jgi:hypothetical protein
LLTTGSLPGGKVIHQLGCSRFEKRLPKLVNNFGRRIRAGVRGETVTTKSTSELCSSFQI